MENTYLKLTPAGQLAAKKITISTIEKSILERVQKEAGFVIQSQILRSEHIDSSIIDNLLLKGWLRETNVSPALSASPLTSSDPPPPIVSSSLSVDEISDDAPNQSTFSPVKVEVSEEEKAKSYENFLKIMGNK